MFIFFFLIKVVSAVDETIVDCAKDVLTTAAGAPMLKKRPTIDPSNCFDLDVGSCTTLFALMMPDNYAKNKNNDP